MFFNENKKKPFIMMTLFLGTIFFISLLLFIYGLVNMTPSQLSLADPNSITRIQQISQLLNYYLGPNWIVVISIFTILFITIIIIIYLISQKGIVINVSDKRYFAIRRSIFAFFVAVTFLIFILGILAFFKYRRDQQLQKNTEGDFYDKSNDIYIYLIIGCVSLTILGIIIWAIMINLKFFTKKGVK